MKASPDKHSSYYQGMKMDPKDTALLKRIKDAISPQLVSDSLSPYRQKKRSMERLLVKLQRSVESHGLYMRWHFDTAERGLVERNGWNVETFPAPWGCMQIALCRKENSTVENKTETKGNTNV